MALSSRPGGGHSSRPLSEINVTPFVDVMLVLLVIFMVTAPLLEWGIQVELPRTVSGRLAGPKQQWTITLTKERAVYLNKQKLSLESLDGKLGALAREDPSTEIYLRADRRLPYGFVMRVVSKVRENGLTQLGLVTDLEDPLPEP